MYLFLGKLAFIIINAKIYFRVAIVGKHITIHQIFLGGHVTDTDGAVVPVINIKAEYAEAMVGTGYNNDPYVMK